MQRRPTRFTSLRLAAALKKFAGQTTPRTAPRACMSELHKLFMSRQARQGGGKDRQSRIFSLHCTDKSIYQLAIQRSTQSAIHPCSFFALSLARSLAHLIRHWQSHPYLAPGNGNGAGTKRHQWPSDLGQQKSLVLISAPGGRPFVFLELAHDGAAGKSAGQATRARPGPSANSITSSLASRLGAEPS